MMKNSKRWLSSILAASMVAASAPFAFAAEPNNAGEGGGSGTAAELAATLDNLGTAAVQVNGLTVSGTVDCSAYTVSDATAKTDFAGALTDNKPKDGKKFVLAKIKFSGLESGNQYTVRQTNAGMNYAFNVTSFEQDQKVKDYSGETLSVGLNFVLADAAKDVKFEIQPKGDDENVWTDDAVGTKAFTVTNELSFVDAVIGADSVAIANLDDRTTDMDDAENDLVLGSDYAAKATAIEGAADTYAVELTATNVKPHENGAGTVGEWVGFSVEVPASVKAQAAGYLWAVGASAEEVKTLSEDAAEMKTNITGTGDKTGAIRYYNKLTAKLPAYYSLQFVDEDKNALTNQATFVVNDLDKVTGLGSVALDKQNLSDLAAETTFAKDTAYDVALSGKDIASGLNAIKAVAPDAYKLFNTGDGNWEEIAKGVSQPYTVVTMTFPAKGNVTVSQTSKALKTFYCQADTVGENGVSKYDPSIKTDAGKDTATKTKSYTDVSGGMTMAFLLMEGDEPVITITWPDDKATATYTVKNAVSFAEGSKSEVVVDVTPTVDGDKATATAPKVEASEVNANTNVVIDAIAAGNDGVKEAEITLPKETVQAVGKAAETTIKTNVGEVTLPQEAVSKINAEKPAVVSIKKTDTAGAQSFDVEVKQDGTAVAIKDLTKPITLTLNVGGALLNPKVYHVTNDGKETLMTSTYDKAKGAVKVPTSHLSTFKVVDSGLITVGEATNGGLGKQVTLTITKAKQDTMVGDTLTVAVKNSAGQTCTISSIALDGDGSGTATVSYQNGAELVGAWVTKGVPVFTGSDLTTGVLAGIAK